MDNIGDIISSLSEKDIENLKNAAQSIFGDEKKESPNNSSLPDFSAIDPQLIAKVTKIMSKLNEPDTRCELIKTLKPFLSGDKQKRADEAMKIIKLIRLLPLIRNLE